MKVGDLALHIDKKYLVKIVKIVKEYKWVQIEYQVGDWTVISGCSMDQISPLSKSQQYLYA